MAEEEEQAEEAKRAEGLAEARARNPRLRPSGDGEMEAAADPVSSVR